MKVKIILFIFLIISSLIFSTKNINAQEPTLQSQETFRAKILKINSEGKQSINGIENLFQKIEVRILDGLEKGKELEIEHGGRFTLSESQKVKAGETVVMMKISTKDTQDYLIIDKYRLDQILNILILFLLSVVILARWKGLGSIVGLAISLLIITGFIVPQILNGRDPVIISIIGSIATALITIYLAHGISTKTTTALVATMLTLTIAGIISKVFIDITNLTGFGSEDAYSLRFGTTSNINLKGLFLGGMIIGTLGILDDITTSLAASIYEIKKANSKISFQKLVRSGFTIGTEHVSSLVNTLVLAYAGASLPIFLFIVINPTQQPLWSILNSEMIAEEIIRTLSGSFALILAVPITVFLAAFTAVRRIKS